MHFSVIGIFVCTICISAVHAADHLIKVGAGGGLVFDPTSVTVAQGDTVSFQFQGKNHTVTQSSFTGPCTRLNANGMQGVDSGFVPVPANATSLPQWSFTVNNASSPLWFYCAQKTPADHCAAGMVFAINPTADKTFDAFQAKAKGNATSSNSSSTPSSTATPSTSVPQIGFSLGFMTTSAIVASLILSGISL